MSTENSKSDLILSAGDTRISTDELMAHIHDLEQPIQSESYKKVVSTNIRIRAIKEKDIIVTPPVLSHNGNPIIHPNTINVVQGQAGTHKSRLLEHMCAALLMRQDCSNSTLGFEKTSKSQQFTVLYVDTERNITEQFPAALQRIQIKAGYEKIDHPENFDYISLIEIDRQERFNVLNEYLGELKKKTNDPIFIVLDVSTDCIEDFNKTEKSMTLIDSMNNTINTHKVIFCCVIHENPGSEKARGHFGTELMNKATTVIQIAFEKDAQKNDLDLVRVKYLKCRSAARYAPFYAKYSQEHHDLVLAEQSDIIGASNARDHKAQIESVCENLRMYLGNGKKMTRTNLLALLIRDHDAGERTIEERIAEIINSKRTICNDAGQECFLRKEKVGNRNGIHYFLEQSIK